MKKKSKDYFKKGLRKPLNSREERNKKRKMPSARRKRHWKRWINWVKRNSSSLRKRISRHFQKWTSILLILEKMEWTLHLDWVRVQLIIRRRRRLRHRRFNSNSSSRKCHLSRWWHSSSLHKGRLHILNRIFWDLQLLKRLLLIKLNRERQKHKCNLVNKLKKSKIKKLTKSTWER